MRKYPIVIYLSDGDTFDANAVADSIEDAVDKITSTEQAIEFIEDREIESVQLLGTEEQEPAPEQRFLL